MADPRPLTRQELSKFLPDQRSIRAFEKLFQLIPNDLLSLLSSIETVRNEAGLALSQSLANTQKINDQKYLISFLFMMCTIYRDQKVA